MLCMVCMVLARNMSLQISPTRLESGNTCASYQPLARRHYAFPHLASVSQPFNAHSPDMHNPRPPCMSPTYALRKSSIKQQRMASECLSHLPAVEAVDCEFSHQLDPICVVLHPNQLTQLVVGFQPPQQPAQQDQFGTSRQRWAQNRKKRNVKEQANEQHCNTLHPGH